MVNRVLLSCGEASGDLYASELVRELRALDGRIECFGLGGNRLAASGAELLVNLGEVSVIGLVEVIEKLPALHRARKTLVDGARRRKPDAAVLIDFSGFNLRLGRSLKKLGVPIIYYVSPQVWAWRRGRIRTIKELVDKMLVILPFEEAFYRDAGVQVRFVGHPLVDLVRTREDRSSFCRRNDLDPERPIVAVLPGSRRSEIELHLPVLAPALVEMRRRRSDLQFVILKAHTVDPEQIKSRLGEAAGFVSLVESSTYEGLTHAAVGMVASGTASVEAALCGTPMVVFYRIGKLSYWLGKPFVRVPHYAMVNLIAESRLVPELIQDEMTVSGVVSEALGLLDDRPRVDRMRAGLEEVRARLGGGGASRRAAEEVMSFIIGN